MKWLSLKRGQAVDRNPLSLSGSFLLMLPRSYSSLSPHGFQYLSLEDHFLFILSTGYPTGIRISQDRVKAPGKTHDPVAIFQDLGVG